MCKQFLKRHKKINRDLNSIIEWLKSNKISLNSGKMELVLNSNLHLKAKNLPKTSTLE